MARPGIEPGSVCDCVSLSLPTRQIYRLEFWHEGTTSSERISRSSFWVKVTGLRIVKVLN